MERSKYLEQQLTTHIQPSRNSFILAKKIKTLFRCLKEYGIKETIKIVKDKIAQAANSARAQAELQRSLQSLHETTMAYIKAKNAKSNQERALEQLEELNKNIKNSNSNSRYDVYDNEGNYLGKIDKR